MNLRKLAHRLRTVVLAAALTLGGNHSIAAPAEPSADDLWKKTAAAYAALETYTDAGTITVESGSGGSVLRETHKFRTALSRPRRFLFAFDEDPNAGAERFVIWCDNAEFRTWWSATGVQATYPQGEGLNAFAIGSSPSKGGAVLIPALIFSTAGLKGPLSAFEDLKSERTTTVDGRNQIRIDGVVRERYGNDYVSSERPTQVWIDARTSLILKVMQDTPRGTAAGSIDRITTIIAPLSGTKLEPAVFRFTIPAGP